MLLVHVVTCRQLPQSQRIEMKMAFDITVTYVTNNPISLR